MSALSLENQPKQVEKIAFLNKLAFCVNNLKSLNQNYLRNYYSLLKQALTNQNYGFFSIVLNQELSPENLFVSISQLVLNISRQDFDFLVELFA